MLGAQENTDTKRPCAYRARWIVPISRPPIEDGVVAVHDGRIVFAGERRAWGESVMDLGDVAILPCLVNAHTHLEFSELAVPFGQRGDSFSGWIPQVVTHRRARVEGMHLASIELGLRESLAYGVGLVGEIATTDEWRESSAASESAGVIFREFLGWDRSRIPEQLDLARVFLARRASGAWLRGLSPHAPYTVHRELLAGLCSLAANSDAPVAMHIAESPAEMDFLATGKGPLRVLLESAGVWQPDFWERPLGVPEILAQLATAKRALVIHGNQLQPGDWAHLAERRERMSVVYCPRTRDFFFPDQKYPLEKMLQHGVAVALGTDSRASNPDLSLWRELLWIAQHQEVSPAQILQLGTEQGARALGFATTHGRLEPGYSASLCVVHGVAMNVTAHELPERLLSSESCSSLHTNGTLSLTRASN